MCESLRVSLWEKLAVRGTRGVPAAARETVGSGDLYGQPFMYFFICIRVCFLCMCAHWEYTLSLAPGWTWGRGAVAALLLLGFRIWTDFPQPVNTKWGATSLPACTGLLRALLVSCGEWLA